MWKQLTGEPVAGELHSGFGGRGRLSPFPTPIRRPNAVSQEFGKRISTCTVPLCLGRDYGPLARDQSVDVLSAATPGALPLVAWQRRLRVAPRHSGTAFSSSCRS